MTNIFGLTNLPQILLGRKLSLDSTSTSQIQCFETHTPNNSDSRTQPTKFKIIQSPYSVWDYEVTKSKISAGWNDWWQEGL